MSSILLLLEDGEMHPFIAEGGAQGGADTHGGQIVLARSCGVSSPDDSPPSLAYTDIGDAETLTLGGHFLSADGLTKDADGNYITKIELDNVPYEVVVEKSDISSFLTSTSSSSLPSLPTTPVQTVSKKGKKSGKAWTEVTSASGSGSGSSALASADRKVCLWPTDNGTCGKTFTKFDSLKRHLSEAHKGVRPFACTLCDKTYGRRDYLQRHLKSHNNSYAVNVAGGTNAANISAAQVTKLVKNENQQPNIIVQPGKVLSSPVGRTVQVVQSTESHVTPSISTSYTVNNSVASPTPQINSPNPLPFYSLSGQLPIAKPMGSKICRWVQNDGTVCGKAFSKLDSLRRHVNELHKGVRPYACTMCEKSYGRRDYLDRHIRQTHEKKHKIDPTLEWGPNSGVLMQGDEEMTPPPPKFPKKKRKDIPPEEKKICLWILEDGTACGKTFTKFDSLKRHVSEGHKGIRPYACSICGKDYGRRDYLMRHLRSHKEIELSNIKIDKVRNNPSNHPANNVNSVGTVVSSPSSSSPSNSSSASILPAINFNQLVPQPPPVFTGVTTANPAATPIRITNPGGKIITGVTTKKMGTEDKKTCKWVLDDGTVCSKTFSKFDSLRRHVAEMHKNMRPFICEICNKSYGRKDYLDRHMKSHDISSLGLTPSILSTGIEESLDSDTMTTTVVVDTGELNDDDGMLSGVITVVSNEGL